MLRELITILRSDNPMSALGHNFNEMLRLTREMTMTAGELFFEHKSVPEERTRIYEADNEVNSLERAIRKQVVSHLSLGNPLDVPYCLLLMSLVKDVERIGDYAKNLSEANELHPQPLPEGDLLGELQEIRRGVEEAFSVTSEILTSSDQERAIEFIHKGRDIAHRADGLVQRVARADYDAATTAAMVLATRYYKRIGGHCLNILSSVVMPLHKIDYYDEDEIPKALKESSD